MTRVVLAAVAAAAAGAVRSANGHCIMSELSVLRGSDLPSTDLFSKADAFAVATYGAGNKCSTNVVENSANPLWTMSCPPRAFKTGDVVRIQVFDKDVVADDLIGTGEVQPRCPAQRECTNEALVTLSNGGTATVSYCLEPVSLAPSCTAPTFETSTCNWYGDCLNAAVPCIGDEAEYALQYGDRKCNDFGAVRDKFSTQGLLWMESVRACLQQALVPKLEHPIPCSALRKDAFTSHIACYLGDGGKYPSICQIVTTDLWAILAAIRGDLLTGESVQQALPVLKSCGSGLVLSALRVVGTIPSAPAAFRGNEAVKFARRPGQCTACDLDDSVAPVLAAAAPLPAETTVRLASMKARDGDAVEMVFLVATKDVAGSTSAAAAIAASADLGQFASAGLVATTVAAFSVEDMESLDSLSVEPQFINGPSPTVAVPEPPAPSNNSTEAVGPAAGVAIGAGAAALVAALIAVQVRRYRGQNHESGRGGVPGSGAEVALPDASFMTRPDATQLASVNPLFRGA